VTNGRGWWPTISTAVATVTVADVTGKGRSIVVLPAVAVDHRNDVVD
jgi:hypothetical protein